MGSGEIEPDAFRAIVAKVRSGSDDTPSPAMKATGQAGTPSRGPERPGELWPANHTPLMLI